MMLLTMVGGYVNLDKSTLQPTTRIDYLGMTIDSEKETIEVPRDKFEKAKAKLGELWVDDVLDVKALERLRGRFMSWTLCVPLSRLMIREQNAVIAKARAQNHWHWTREEVAETDLVLEMAFWESLSLEALCRPWRQDRHEVFCVDSERTKAVYTDASSFALGGRLFKVDNFKDDDGLHQPKEADVLAEAFFQISTDGGDQPIHVKEIDVMLKTMIAIQDKVRDQHVTFYVDNAAVVAAFNSLGARDLRLSRAMKKILALCIKLNIKMAVEWISTKLQLADALSRTTMVSESKLRPKMRHLIKDVFCPTIDVFASDQNRLYRTIRYCSRFREENAVCTNGLAFKVRHSQIIN